MNELRLTELDMGIALPKILQAYKPTIDYKGIALNFNVVGCINNRKLSYCYLIIMCTQ